MSSSSVKPAQPAKRQHQRLRFELLCALALKLVLLFSMKAAFFPQRVSTDAAAQGVVDRIASSTFSVHESVSKEQP